MQQKWIFPCYNENIGASFLSTMLGKWSPICPLPAAGPDHTHYNVLTTHLLKAFPLSVLDAILNRKPIFDPVLQISVLVPDNLGGFAMLAAAMTACSCHGWRHSGDSSGRGGNCQTAAALMNFGKNLPAPRPKLAILVLSPAFPKP